MSCILHFHHTMKWQCNIVVFKANAYTLERFQKCSTFIEKKLTSVHDVFDFVEDSNDDDDLPTKTQKRICLSENVNNDVTVSLHSLVYSHKEFWVFVSFVITLHYYTLLLHGVVNVQVTTFPQEHFAVVGLWI